MKRVLFFIFFIFLFCNSFAQVTITNKGITITNASQNIYVNGSIVNETTGLIKNNGSIYVNGNISNNSASSSFSDSSNGVFYLHGSHQVIGGSRPLNFNHI